MVAIDRRRALGHGWPVGRGVSCERTRGRESGPGSGGGPPKEQPPPESLRQKDRPPAIVPTVWKVPRAAGAAEGVSGPPGSRRPRESSQVS